MMDKCAHCKESMDEFSCGFCLEPMHFDCGVECDICGESGMCGECLIVHKEEEHESDDEK